MGEPVLALDIGGTKIAGALVDRTGRVLRDAVRATPRPTDGTGALGVFDAVRAVVRELATEPVRAFGISCAGPVDTGAGTVSPINITSWRDFPLRDRVGELAPDVPIFLAGDGICMALGEQWRGAGRGDDAMLGMVVSTGVGGGLVLGGRPFGGRTGNAGHVGHVVVEPGGESCTCGGRGCVETVASGPALVRWARRQGWRPPDAGGTTIGARDGASELAAAARAGDSIAAAAFRRGGWAVGLAIVATAAVCDLDLAVVGGGVAQAGDLLFDPVREAVAKHAGLSFIAGLRVEAAELGTKAGLLGAAALALRSN